MANAGLVTSVSVSAARQEAYRGISLPLLGASRVLLRFAFGVNLRRRISKVFASQTDLRNTNESQRRLPRPTASSARMGCAEYRPLACA